MEQQMHEDCHLLGKARRWKQAEQGPGPETLRFIAQRMIGWPNTAKKSHVEIQQPETLAERDHPGHTYSSVLFSGNWATYFIQKGELEESQVLFNFVLWEKSAISEFVFHSESGNTFVINCNSKIV